MWSRNLNPEGACTNTGFSPESDPAPIVFFFARTGITAAGGQFDFECCTRKRLVHRNSKRNLLVLLCLSYRLKYLKQSSGTDRFKHVFKFQCSYIETDKMAAGPAGPAACENTHLFTLHPVPESDPAPVLPVCVQAPWGCLGPIWALHHKQKEETLGLDVSLNIVDWVTRLGRGKGKWHILGIFTYFGLKLPVLQNTKELAGSGVSASEDFVRKSGIVEEG